MKARMQTGFDTEALQSHTLRSFLNLTGSSLAKIRCVFLDSKYKLNVHPIVKTLISSYTEWIAIIIKFLLMPTYFTFLRPNIFLGTCFQTSSIPSDTFLSHTEQPEIYCWVYTGIITAGVRDDANLFWYTPSNIKITLPNTVGILAKQQLHKGGH
jgi:hypothetical protein